MAKRTKTFLECMMTDLDDISEGTDEEVLKKLGEMGINAAKAGESFRRLIKCLKERKNEETEGN